MRFRLKRYAGLLGQREIAVPPPRIVDGTIGGVAGGAKSLSAEEKALPFESRRRLTIVSRRSLRAVLQPLILRPDRPMGRWEG